MWGIWDDTLISEAWKQRENRGEVRLDILRVDVLPSYSVFVQLHNVQIFGSYLAEGSEFPVNSLALSKVKLPFVLRKIRNQ